MVDRLEQTAHVTGSLVLTEGLVLLLRDFLEKRLACDILHDEVDVLLVVVGLVVLDDVGVVEGVEDGDLLHDAVDVVAQLLLVKHLDGHFKV